MVRCLSPQRRRWKINLHDDLILRSNTDQILANIGIDGLFHWFHQIPQTPHFITPTNDGLIISHNPN
jgi:hypothetical protein